MKSVSTILITAAAVAASAYVLAAAAGNSSTHSSTPARAELIRRGDYLVNRAGLCIDCHSPRDERGAFLPGKHLTGAPIGFTPTVPMPWMPAAPRIAGLPAGFTAEAMVHFLMTGERPNGLPAPLPPMPPYRFDREDAEAVTAYLASLPSATP